MFGWSNNDTARQFGLRHGINFVGADTPGLPAANLTVDNAIRQLQANRAASASPVRKNVVYASVVFTDGDNIGVLIGHHEARWVSSAAARSRLAGQCKGWRPLGSCPRRTALLRNRDIPDDWSPGSPSGIPTYSPSSTTLFGRTMWPRLNWRWRAGLVVSRTSLTGTRSLLNRMRVMAAPPW